MVNVPYDLYSVTLFTFLIFAMGSGLCTVFRSAQLYQVINPETARKRLQIVLV